MYPLPTDQLSLLDDFYLPFSGKLSADNCWVQLASVIPWDVIEQRYASLFAEGQGAPAKPVRMALGALIIKEKCGLSDRDTVEQIRENPYLQFFIGLKEFQNDVPFNPSLMVQFRKRLGIETLKELNELICNEDSKDTTDNENDNDQNDKQNPGNPNNSSRSKCKAKNKTQKQSKVNAAGHMLKGKLLLDATCAPQICVTQQTCHC